MSVIDKMVEDLDKSGLIVDDMLCRIPDETELHACNLSTNVEGYVIPYFNLMGEIIPHYRIRIFDVEDRYRQVKGTANHVYFPKDFLKVWERNKFRYVIMTEGEKKAALACKLGIPCIAFGGVDSWVNKTLVLPEGTEIAPYSRNKKMIGAKIPAANVEEIITGVLAKGLDDLIDQGIKYKTTFFIVFDTDSSLGIKPAVQRSSAKLGYEFRYKGVPIKNIKQMVLPNLVGLNKTGLDDFLLHDDGGVRNLIQLLDDCWAKKTAFPKHPNVREHINTVLQRPRLDRKQVQNLSLAVITELDSRGRRMFSRDESQMFYFNGDTHELMRVDINTPRAETIHETMFGKVLYKDYGLSPAADGRLMQWLGAQFAGEDPIEDVTPHRVLARPESGEDVIKFQINDSQYLKVTGDVKKPFIILPNGTENVLFDSGYVNSIDHKELHNALIRRHKEATDNGGIPKPWWHDVLSEVRFKDAGKHVDLITLLYYISPWLYRWRGMQLPAELVIGESGSGKSTLLEVRLNIIQGEASLRNSPQSLKDWYASIVNAGTLHVTDNIAMGDKQLRQQLSDEICRLITEPDPHVEMRKYFTEADLRRIQVNSVFCFTAIRNPFGNTDFLQRSIILELDKSKELNTKGLKTITYDSFWKEHQLQRFGGRVEWIAHHMYVLHKFFKLVKERWNPHYRSKHRLVGFEQSLMIMAQVFGMDHSWIPNYLLERSDDLVKKGDRVIEGLENFARTHAKLDNFRFKAGNISDWASRTSEYEKEFGLINSRSLGRYMQSFKYNIAVLAGIVEDGSVNNATMYKISDEFKKKQKRPINEAYTAET